jgi:hypothetical protein
MHPTLNHCLRQYKKNRTVFTEDFSGGLVSIVPLVYSISIIFFLIRKHIFQEITFGYFLDKG